MSYDMLSSKKQKLNTEREKLTPPYSMWPIVRNSSGRSAAAAEGTADMSALTAYKK